MFLLLNLLLAPSLLVTVSLQNPEIGLGNRFVIIIIAILIALFSRFILMKVMNRGMMSKSKKLKDSELGLQIAEIQNSSSIKFTVLDSDSDFSDTSSNRQEMVNNAKKVMIQQFKLDILIVLVYAIAALVIYADYPLDALQYFLYLTLFLIWTIMRFIGFRHQFKAYQEGLFKFISPIWKMVFVIFQTRWYMLLALIVLLSTLLKSLSGFLFGDYGEGVVFLIPIIFHLVTINRIRSKAKNRPNLKLLILRVFLISKTSMFTFSRLAKFWKHFGSYFTVADPSFYKVYWKRNFKHKFPVIIVFTFLIYTQLENSSIDSGAGSPFGPFIFLMVIAAIVFIIYSRRRMKLNFVSDKEELNKDIEKLIKHPVKLDNTFKEKPMSCHDNTWKLTVNKLVTTANVVLMDLRGFSEKNKGCEFEVNLLLNTVSLDKILFIGYTSALPLIKDVIQRKFKTLEQESPNINITNPNAVIYEVKKESNKETQQILDLLISKAIVN
ncbi:hypothetical protein [Pontimicrobium aquaticum]|uniref:Uncharacterized protein n=1 Tax=Pontimicrobium aquaticum TaxID=2565367 RepID=A0A4U0EP97_9FLAO|nr:hypothetical protein [Pontimicrobium aquaticum]TJY33370.1 hypothetical protein E5167_12775 [Pontimicrobium aquaticum]